MFTSNRSKPITVGLWYFQCSFRPLNCVIFCLWMVSIKFDFILLWFICQFTGAAQKLSEALESHNICNLHLKGTPWLGTQWSKFVKDTSSQLLIFKHFTSSSSDSKETWMLQNCHSVSPSVHCSPSSISPHFVHLTLSPGGMWREHKCFQHTIYSSVHYLFQNSITIII